MKAQALRLLARLSGSLAIPHAAEHVPCALLHVSDTPSVFYPDLARLLAAVRPRFVIHTGDLADEIKIRSGVLDRALYGQKTKSLLEILEASGATRVFLLMGNHDDPETVRGLARRAEVLEGCALLDLEGVRIAAAHRPEDLWEHVADLNLYGHDTSVLPPDVDGRLYLNGNVKIRVIDLESREVVSIDYPRSVHDARQKKRKTGL